MTPTTPAVSDEGLLPCPFCDWHPASGAHPTVFHVENGCTLGGWYFSAEAWNKRATRPPVKGDSVELVEDLTREIDNMDLLQVDCGLTERQLRDIRAHITALSERVVVLEGVLREARAIVAPWTLYPTERDLLAKIDAALKGCDALGGGE